MRNDSQRPGVFFAMFEQPLAKVSYHPGPWKTTSSPVFPNYATTQMGSFMASLCSTIHSTSKKRSCSIKVFALRAFPCVTIVWLALVKTISICVIKCMSQEGIFFGNHVEMFVVIIKIQNSLGFLAVNLNVKHVFSVFIVHFDLKIFEFR